MGVDRSFSRYLAAKKTVDDRALNRHVVETLRRELGALQRPLRIIEVGAGLGTMVARMIDWDLIKTGEYCLLEPDRTISVDSRAWLGSWATQTGRSIDVSEDVLRIRDARAGVDVVVRSVCADLDAFVELGTTHGSAELLVANAVLDLLDLPRALPRLFELLVPGGLYWFSINFDGETTFEPEHPLDRTLMDVYHRSMNERARQGSFGGDSRTGRHLFNRLGAAGASILAAGSSDWVVHAQVGRYGADEAEFLRYILDTIDRELRRHAEIDQAGLGDWLSVRKVQVDRAELVYLARQLDFCGRGE